MEKCKNKAECIVSWGSKIYKCCNQHARALKMISSAIGSDIDIKSLPKNEDVCELNDDLNN